MSQFVERVSVPTVEPAAAEVHGKSHAVVLPHSPSDAVPSFQNHHMHACLREKACCGQATYAAPDDADADFLGPAEMEKERRERGEEEEEREMETEARGRGRRREVRD